MLRRLILFIACGCAACVPAPPIVAPPGPPFLTVITFNMYRGHGDVRRLISDLDSGRLSAARDYVLLLQEFRDREDGRARVQSDEHPLFTFFSPVRDDISNVIAATMPLEDAHTIALPRERQLRSAAAAAFTLRGERLFIVSVHLENRLAWYRGLFGDRARGRQADALLDAIPAAGHGIVGGDMNTMLGPQEPAWQALVRRFPQTPNRLEPTMRDRAVLDHLFVDLPDSWRMTRRVIPEQYGSDHHPLVGDVSLAGR